MTKYNLSTRAILLVLIFDVGCGVAEVGPGGDGDPAAGEGSALERVNPSGAYAPFSGAMPACGTALASFDGTTAYSNGPYTSTGSSCAGAGTYGLRYQCPELVMRHFKTHWGLRWWGNARDLLKNAPTGSVDVYYNGDGAHPPVPGDMLVWTNSTWGHVALVTAVSSGGVDIIEQNVKGNGRDTLPYDGKSIGARWGSWVPAGWAHARANHAKSGSPSPSPPPSPPPPPPPSGGQCSWKGGYNYRKCGGCGWQFCLSSGSWSAGCAAAPNVYACPAGSYCGTDAQCHGAGPVCGDGKCDSGESCSSCAKDCGSCGLPNWSSCTADGQCQSQRCGCNGGTKMVCLPTSKYPKFCTTPGCQWGSSGNNGDSCGGVPAETWRCVKSSALGAQVSQVCRGGAWLNYHLNPQACGSCCGSYSSACQ